MTALYWIGGILLLLWLLGRTRLGIFLQAEERLILDLKIGPFRVHLVGGTETSKNKEDKPTSDKEKKEITVDDLKDKLPKISFSDIKEIYETLWPPCRNALRRLWCDLEIKPLQAELTLGGQNDPAEAAKLCGWLQAAVWTGMPALEQLVYIPEPGVCIGVNYERSDWQLRGAAGVTLSVGALTAMGFELAWPALTLLLGWSKRKKREKTKTTQPQARENKTVA